MAGRSNICAYLSIMLLISVLFIHVPNASADEIAVTGYSESISSQSTWSEVKLTSNGFDSSNSTATYLEANRCNGGTASCSSGQTYIIVDYTLQMSVNTTRADVRWAVSNADNLIPADSKAVISIWNNSNSRYNLQVEDTSINSTQTVELIPITSHNLDSSNQIKMRFSLYHNGSDFDRDELVVSLFSIFDIRETIPDTDGDGIFDSSDMCANGETGWISDSSNDYDGDGCKDSSEDDNDDNDWVNDDLDNCSKGELSWDLSSVNDHDEDGCHDLLEDNDDDNDGFTDTIEANCLSDPLDDQSIPLNTDGTGDCDELDTDDDDDGFSDIIEVNCLSDPLDDQSIPLNTDGTGDCDELDDDDDDDGTPDTEDDFPFDPLEQTDTDDDGVGDNADQDDDWDSFNDTEEIDCGSDPLNSTSIPANFDGDELCDELDPDDDNDGFNDTIDAFPLNSIEWADFDGDGTGDVADPDDDNDGFADAYEEGCGTNSNDNSSSPQDLDDDGQCDGQDDDDDGDGWSDEMENDCATNSLSNSSTPPDMDGDGQCDAVDLDTDGDGWSNSEEEDCQTNHLNNMSTPIDTDNDSICDYLDNENDLDNDNPVDNSTENNNSLNNSHNNATENNSQNDDDLNNTQSNDNNSSTQDLDEGGSDNESTPSDFDVFILCLISGLLLVGVSVYIYIVEKRGLGIEILEKSDIEHENKELKVQLDEERERGKQKDSVILEVAANLSEANKNLSSTNEEVVSTIGPAVGALSKVQDQMIDDFESNVNKPKAYLIACLDFIEGKINQIPVELVNWAKNRHADQKIKLELSVGCTYFPSENTQEQAGAIIGKCVLDFFATSGGQASNIVGGYRPDKSSEVFLENSIKLVASISYSALTASIDTFREICINYCKELHQKCVHLSLFGDSLVGRVVYPLSGKDKHEVDEVREKGEEKSYPKQFIPKNIAGRFYIQDTDTNEWLPKVE